MKSPFKFLDAFTLSDKDAFFGRDQEIDTSYNTVFKTPLVLVYGSSGTGKTSLIQCGLANRFDGPDWYPIFIRRNDDLNVSVTEAMKEALGELAKGDLAEDASLLLRKSLRPVYFLFDQFEELFIRGDEKEQVKFMNSLRKLLDAGLACKIVLIMREEFIAQMYSYENLIPELFDHRFRVEAMGPVKVRKVISSSFEKFNIHLAAPKEELLDLMVANVNDTKTGIALPYLQVYLDMLYRDVYKRKIGDEASEEYPHLEVTKEDIESVGRIDNVLVRFLENQTLELGKQLEKKYDNVNPRAIQTVLNVFVTDEGTKNPVQYKMDGENIVLSEDASIFLKDIPEAMLTEIITSLNIARILRKGEKSIELAHDSLALIIHKRKSDSDRLLQGIRRRLLNAHDEFKKTGAYLNKKQLAAFDQFKPQLALSPELETFLDECDKEITRRESEKQERAIEESKMAQKKKSARVRTILFIVIGLLVVGAAWSITAILANKNHKLSLEKEKLSLEKESLKEEKKETEAHMDSIAQIIVQVNQQIGRMDSIISGDLKPKELVKTVITLKSIVRNDTISSIEMEQKYVTILELFTSNNHIGGPEYSKRDSVMVTDTAYLSIHLNTPQHKEFIQVKWLSADGNLIGEPSYYEVKAGDEGAWIGLKKEFEIAGIYRAEVYNSQGFEIGRIHFRMDNAKVNYINTTVAEFRTMKSGTMKNPGPHTSDFIVGDKLYYWVRIISPTEDSIAVQLIDDTENVVWEDNYVTDVNTDFGSRIINWHGANLSGNYSIRIINSNGKLLKRDALQIR